MLLSHPNQIVATGSLAEALWGEAPPKSHVKNLQHYIHKLRRAVGDSRIAFQGHGYLIRLGPGELDAIMFEELAAQARTSAAAGQLGAARSQVAQALRLWRGPAFADVGDIPQLQASIARWSELRLSTWEESFELSLAAGDPREVVAESAGLVADHPLRERLRGLRMIALYRCGRPADALQSYHEGRKLLAEELGVEPTEALQEIYLAITRGQDPGRTAPTVRTGVAQLPADIPDFVGRVEAMSELDAWAKPAGPHAPLIVTGGAGLGKTALAVHWGHRHAQAHDLEHLIVNLRGYSGAEPMQPIEALAYFLGCLNVAPHEIPVDVVQAAALYRSRLAGRRILIILDNAGSAEQVRQLLPGSPTALVMVTSRDRLTGLVAREGARRVALERFSHDEAIDLLTRMVGADLTTTWAQKLAVLCGHLPLALRVAAANLADGRYASAGKLLAEAAETAWPDAVDLDDDVESGTKIAFDHSYARLPEPEQRLFRLLSIVPGPDFSVSAAAALIAEPVRSTQSRVHRLAGAHLLEQQGLGRFGMHDLVRRYARTACENTDSPSVLSGLRQHLYHHYLRYGDAAARLVYPQILRLPWAATTSEQIFEDQEAAMCWLDAERASLVAAVQDAANHDHLEAAWLLADMLRGYFSVRRHMGDWLKVARLAVRAAETAADEAAQVSAGLSLSMALWFLGEHAEAAQRLTDVAGLARSVGWHNAETSCLTNLGGIYGDWGKLTEAAEYLAQALRRHPQDGPAATRASILSNLGAVCHDLGRLDESVAHHNAALKLFEELGAELGSARALANLGETLLTKGWLDESQRRLEAALVRLNGLHDRYSQAATLVNLARLHLELRDTELAADFASRGLEIAEEINAKNYVSSAMTVLATVERNPSRHKEAVETARERGAGYMEADALAAAAQTLVGLGRLAEASKLCLGAISASRRGGYRNIEATALVQLGEIRRGQGKAEEARAAGTEARDILRTTGCVRFEARVERLLG